MRCSTKTSVALILLILVGCQTYRYTTETTTTENVTRDIAQVVDLVKEIDPLSPQSFDRLADYSPHKYEILFTDPICGVYKYKKEMLSQSGKRLTQKPENVYCKNKYDLKRSSENPMSPQYRLIEWINDPATKEIFFTYLSFSNKAVRTALCDAAQKRDVKINFVIGDDPNTTDDDKSQVIADELVACSPKNIQKKTRGMEGGLGYAHNKFFIINPSTLGEFKIVFSSGNMSSGPVIHHENWNFVTTNSQSYFAQSHLCAMNAEWSETSGRSREGYIKSIRKCRDGIKTPPEKDVRVFFVPGEGEPEKGVTRKNRKTAVEYMLNGDGKFPGILNANKIWLGCHRFMYSKMVDALAKRMDSKYRPDLKIVADDDTFFEVNDPKYEGFGETMPVEFEKMKRLIAKGAQAKFMETNAEEHQLHHSKYLIFADKSDKFTAVFTGSANLTGAGFNKNWENSYYITIPEVVQQFADHYVKMWDTMATSINDLPKEGIVSEYLEEVPEISNSAK